MRDLVRSQLGHYSDRIGSQIGLEGPRMRVQPQAAQYIGMALHELATNAAKYGALSVPEGRVRVSWTINTRPDGERWCTLSWQEEDGPEVASPTRHGFGRVVTERVVARAVNGEATSTFLPRGVRWTLTFPAREMIEEAAFANS
jgi:two-component sensor histidine kinase